MNKALWDCNNPKNRQKYIHNINSDMSPLQSYHSAWERIMKMEVLHMQIKAFGKSTKETYPF